MLAGANRLTVASAGALDFYSVALNSTQLNVYSPIKQSRDTAVITTDAWQVASEAYAYLCWPPMVITI